MSRDQANVTAAPAIFRSKLKSWLERSRQRLYIYRPRFRDWHFWAVQSLVIGIAAIHDIIEVGGYAPQLGMLYFVPISLFFVPVVYAALNFGFVGAITTALWAVIITIPNWIFWHEGLERLGVIFQMLIVIALAFFVGQRVDRERRAWHRAEATATDLKASRMKYRGIFESSPIAILVLDPTGLILEANPAAIILFARNKTTLEGIRIADLIGTASEQKLLGSSQNGSWQADPLVLKLGDGPELYLEPALTEFSDGEGNLAIQVLFRDATEEHDRQAGLKAYTAYVIRAQEEERQRIARELHDETIQSLVLLCRRLDSVQDSSDSLPSSQLDKLQEARKIAEEVVKGLRDFTKALRPPILDDLGVVTSVRRLLADFTERTRIKGQLKVVGETRRLPADTELGMFRIAQEALRNIERHAGATRVAVTVTFAKHEARLDVVDNGAGFSMASSSGDFTASGKLGLLSMQERAELLGGNLKIQSRPGNGTRVTVSAPAADGIPQMPNQA